MTSSEATHRGLTAIVNELGTDAAKHFDNLPLEEVTTYLKTKQTAILLGTLRFEYWKRQRMVDQLYERVIPGLGEKVTRTRQVLRKVRRGLVVGFLDTYGIAHVGWSLCSTSDTFDPDRALAAALCRAVPINRYLVPGSVDVPMSLKPLVRHMLLRAYAAAVRRFF